MSARILWCGLALKLIILFALAVNTIFVMDEMAFLGRSKDLFNGLYETIWPSKSVGYSIVFAPAHIIGWNAQSTLITGRLIAALATCLSLLLIYQLALALGKDKTRALAIVFLILCFSTFMERAFRTRAEPIGLVFGLASLWYVVRGKTDDMRRIFVAGIIAGLAFLIHQKAVYYNLALGTALVGDAFFQRKFVTGIQRGALLVAGWISAILAYCLLFGGLDFFLVLKNLFVSPVELVLEGATYYSDWNAFRLQTFSRNSVLYLLGGVGLFLTALNLLKLDEKIRISLIFSVIISILIITHNQPWPYVFVMAIPFLALWVFEPIDRLGSHSIVQNTVLAIIALFVVLSFARNIAYLDRDNRNQLLLINQTEHLLDKTDTYLDGTGMLPNRYQAAVASWDTIAVAKIKAFGIETDLLTRIYESSPKVFVTTYRSEKLKDELEPFLANRYVPIYPNILVAGRELAPGETTSFNAPYGGQY